MGYMGSARDAGASPFIIPIAILRFSDRARDVGDTQSEKTPVTGHFLTQERSVEEGEESLPAATGRPLGSSATQEKIGHEYLDGDDVNETELSAIVSQKSQDCCSFIGRWQSWRKRWACRCLGLFSTGSCSYATVASGVTLVARLLEQAGATLPTHRTRRRGPAARWRSREAQTAS